jgi:uncharacterized protein with PQ loop repeat
MNQNLRIITVAVDVCVQRRTIAQKHYCNTFYALFRKLSSRMVDASGDAILAVIGIVFTVLTFMVYLPQIVELILFRHTVGVSFFSVWIANMNGFAGCWNIWMLNAYALKICHRDSLDCTNNILAVLQISLSWWMPLITYVTFLCCFVDERIVPNPRKRLKVLPPTTDKWKLRQWWLIIFWTIVYAIFMIALFAIYIPLAINYGIKATPTLTYAYVVGYISAALNVVQWLPQIVTTIRKKSSGSLSVLGVLLMTPGNFAQAGWLIAANQDVTTWITLMIAGMQMITLFLLLVYYDMILPRLRKLTSKKEIIQEVEMEEIEYNGCDDEFAIRSCITKIPTPIKQLEETNISEG